MKRIATVSTDVQFSLDDIKELLENEEEQVKGQEISEGNYGAFNFPKNKETISQKLRKLFRRVLWKMKAPNSSSEIS